MAFQKGLSGNPGGRPAGAKNRVTPEIRVLAQRLFDAQYWQRVQAQLRAGTLHPSIEARLLSYAYGEPRSHDAGPRTVVSIGFLNPPGDGETDEPRTVGRTASGISAPARGGLKVAAGDHHQVDDSALNGSLRSTERD
jgi:hypothetical protein